MVDQRHIERSRDVLWAGQKVQTKVERYMTPSVINNSTSWLEKILVGVVGRPRRA